MSNKENGFCKKNTEPKFYGFWKHYEDVKLHKLIDDVR